MGNETIGLLILYAMSLKIFLVLAKFINIYSVIFPLLLVYKVLTHLNVKQ